MTDIEEIVVADGADIPLDERIFNSKTDPKITAFHVVTLEKVAESKSPPRRVKPWLTRRTANVGEQFTYTYKSLDRNTALSRASAALIREFPDEDRLNWKLVDHT
jgi:hypothetical protein